MRTPSVVKSQVIDDAQFCLVSGCELLIVQLFVFQASEYPLRRAVVPAVALAAYALLHAHGLQMLAVFGAGALAAAIRGVHEAARRGFISYRCLL